MDLDVLADLAPFAEEALPWVQGPTLALWSAADQVTLPNAALPVDTWGSASAPDRSYRSVVSVGQLGTAAHLVPLLGQVRDRLDADGILVFCEPTIGRQEPTDAPPHDVTTSLWRNGFTVIECHRARRRFRWRTQEYCWGRARITPAWAPTRQWAAP